MNEIVPQAVDSTSRPCYCSLWHDPAGRALLEKQRIPYGYCAICGVCGKPGHARHDPSGPGSGGWCDECYGAAVRERHQSG